MVPTTELDNFKVSFYPQATWAPHTKMGWSLAVAAFLTPGQVHEGLLLTTIYFTLTAACNVAFSCCVVYGLSRWR